MSGMSTSDLYAVVDLSKKKNKKAGDKAEDGQPSNKDVLLNDVRNSNDYEDKNLKPDIKSEFSQEKSNFVKTLSTNAFCAFVLIVTWVMLVIMIIMVVIIFVKVSTLENTSTSKTDQRQNVSALHQSSIPEEDIDKQVEIKFAELINTMPNITVVIETLQIMSELFEDRVREINSSIDSIYGFLDSIQNSFQNNTIDAYFSSCSHIWSQHSSYKSGRYIVRSSTGVLRLVYCDMTNVFGSTSLGWMRIANLNANQCPQGLMTRINSTTSTCVVSLGPAGCTTITYSTSEVSYSKVTGRIRGYQIGTLDGFTGINHAARNSNNPVDGVRITTSNEHVWTFAAGCQCSGMRPGPIGNNYTCDGHAGCGMNKFCNTHLWESQKCGEPSSPWFLRTLTPTISDIEVKICRDQRRDDEDLAISSLEIYIQ